MGQGNQIKGKTWEVLVPEEAKIETESQLWGHPIFPRRAKFWVTVTDIFRGNIRGSDTNFRGKFWSQDPRPPDIEVPPGINVLKR